MKVRMLVATLVAVACLFIVGIGSARAGMAGGAASGPDPFQLTFDENGNAHYITNTGGSGNITGTLMADPTHGVSGNVLIYALPQTPVFTGDVLIYNSTGTTLSDLIRFTNSSGEDSGGLDGTELIFYSLKGGGNLADTGLPSTASTFSIREDAAGHIDYNLGYPNNNEYVATSNDTAAAPEPGSIVLASMGIVGLVGYGWRRRKLALKK